MSNDLDDAYWAGYQVGTNNWLAKAYNARPWEMLPGFGSLRLDVECKRGYDDGWREMAEVDALVE